VTSEAQVERKFPRYEGYVTWEEMRATSFKHITDEQMEAGAKVMTMKCDAYALGEVRAKSRFTKRKMAKKLGVSRHLICAFEKGEVADEDLIGAYQRILGEAGHTLPERLRYEMTPVRANSN
jgi:DNA-binding XRE family transcriptional regulator